MEVAEDTKPRNVVEGERYPVLDPAKDCVWGADLLPFAQPWCEGAVTLRGEREGAAGLYSPRVRG